ncbi:MAG: NUDIX hydrolase [Chloroflexi bacterium]|nr:MAG: NUDIX hydrolase [Chloroflexota bacterium]
MSTIDTRAQVSAGGVAYRWKGETIEVALISVGESARWQLPKGTVGKGETTEAAAMREVREEAGIHVELIQPIDTIDYWFYAGGGKNRVHKYVHFFLMQYLSGDVSDHDHEVNEARWFEIGEAEEALAFKSEKEMVIKAREMIDGSRDA